MKDTPHDVAEHLDMLEVPPDATFPEIRKAYLQLKTLYSTDSMATWPLSEDLSDEQRTEILDRIEKAYYNLLNHFRKDDPDTKTETDALPAGAGDRLAEALAGISTFTGPALQQIRERLGIALHDIALATKIQHRYLEKLEAESFEELPPEAYVRGIVVNYAQHLSLDAQKVADDIMKRYKEWKEQH